MHGKLQWLTIVVISFGGEARILIEALRLGNLFSDLLDLSSDGLESEKLYSDLLASCLFDASLTSRAVHKSERYLQGAPSILEEFEYTVRMKDVSAIELDARLRLELTGVAD